MKDGSKYKGLQELGLEDVDAILEWIKNLDFELQEKLEKVN